ncbi:hypothetical protein [Desulfuromonas versatilis]|nr:hypothetical protein [Desulfuromonas versatilis]
MSELLQRSIADYRLLGQGYEAVAAALAGGDYGAVAGGLAELQELEARVRLTDRDLADVAEPAGGPQAGSLWQERLLVLDEVAAKNRRLRDHSRTLLALLAEERSQLKGGQVAMTGYRSGAGQRGSLLSSAC